MQQIKVSVDAVVFGYTSEEGLTLLLIKRGIAPFKEHWALPGGLVMNQETLEEAVTRELIEETGVSINYLEQLYTFGNLNRDPRNRVVSVAYYGLVKPGAFKIKANTDAKDVQWFNVKKLPKLAFDHQEIVNTAIARLKGKIVYEPIGFELLPQKFPFSELEKLYSAVLDKSLDRRNFKKKIMRYGFILETSEKQKLSGAGRRGNLHKFDKKKYFQLKKQGINIEL
jgi:8-oxo-dGTP diphosphatase